MHKWAECIIKSVKDKADEIGIDNLSPEDIHEMKMWTAIVSNIVSYEKDYKIIEAMENADDEENMEMIERYTDYPEKKYYHRKRDKKLPAEYKMDLDDYKKMTPEEMRQRDHMMGRMYFTEPSKYENAKRHYTETKDMHNTGTEMDDTVLSEEMSKWIDVMGAELKESLATAKPKVKTMAKQKLANLANTIV